MTETDNVPASFDSEDAKIRYILEEYIKSVQSGVNPSRFVLRDANKKVLAIPRTVTAIKQSAHPVYMELEMEVEAAEIEWHAKWIEICEHQASGKIRGCSKTLESILRRDHGITDSATEVLQRDRERLFAIADALARSAAAREKEEERQGRIYLM